MKKELEKTEAQKFIDCVEAGIECWQMAGEWLVKFHAARPAVLGEILGHCPWLNESALQLFLRIGRKEIHPKVLLLPPALAEVVARLPLTTQAHLVQKPVPQIRRMVRHITPTVNHTPPPAGRNAAGLADRMPTIGFWKVTVMNGKAFMARCNPDDRAIPVVLDANKSFVLQVLEASARNSHREESEDVAAPVPDYRKFLEK